MAPKTTVGRTSTLTLRSNKLNAEGGGRQGQTAVFLKTVEKVVTTSGSLKFSSVARKGNAVKFFLGKIEQL